MSWQDPVKEEHYYDNKDDYIAAAKRWRKASPRNRRKYLETQRRYKLKLILNLHKNCIKLLQATIPGNWIRDKMSYRLEWNGIRLSYSIVAKYFKIDESYRTKDQQQFIAQVYLLYSQSYHSPIQSAS